MIDEKIIEGLREYLKDHYIPLGDSIGIGESIRGIAQHKTMAAIGVGVAYNLKRPSLRDISDDASEYINEHREPGGFAYALEWKREEKGLTPAELYKRANVDRRQYSRFMGPEGRHPSKNTVISFALALRLEGEEFDEVLQTAGYALSNSSSQDVCIMYCLENRIYDIDEVNALLFAIGIQPLTRE
jgi:hypothetical protein